MKQVVIMPGGFHPFHAGHAALYQSARQAFPGADVYVAATNDTSNRPFPFQLKEKLAQLAGVPKGRFMQVKSPFGAEEILAPYNADDTQLIFVKSEKNSKTGPSPEGPFPAEPDPATGQLPLVTRGARKGLPVSDRLQYYRKGQPTAPMSRHSYLAYLPTVEFGPGITSGSEIRNIWPKLNEKRKTALVMSLYPKTQSNPKLAANVVNMLDTAIGTEVAENQGWAATYEADSLTAGTGVTGGMHASYQDRYNQPVTEQQQLSGKISARPSQDPNQEWDYYYQDQLIKPGSDIHNKVKDIHFGQRYPEYQDTKDAVNRAFRNPIKPGANIPSNQRPENQPGADRVVPPPLTIPKQFIKDLDGNPVRLKDFVPGDPKISEDYVEERRS